MAQQPELKDGAWYWIKPKLHTGNTEWEVSQCIIRKENDITFSMHNTGEHHYELDDIEEFDGEVTRNEIPSVDLSQIKPLLNEEDMIDILSTALEGGSNYWYLLLNVEATKDYEGVTFVEKLYKALMDGKQFIVQDVESEEEIGVLNGVRMLVAERLMLDDETGKVALGNILAENWDAETADIWLQFVVLGKIIYG